MLLTETMGAVSTLCNNIATLCGGSDNYHSIFIINTSFFFGFEFKGRVINMVNGS